MLILGEGVCALLSSYLLEPVIAACSYYPDEEDEAGDGEESGGQAEDGGRAEDDDRNESSGRGGSDGAEETGGAGR
jgi:hypothetical protein